MGRQTFAGLTRLLLAPARRLHVALRTSLLGTAMELKAEDLRSWMAGARSWPVNQDRAEVRLQATFITAVSLLLFFEPIFYIAWVPDALVRKVASLATFPWLLLAVFAGALIATLPHFVTLLFFPNLLHVKCFRRWAAAGAFASAVGWVLLASLAAPLDMGAVEVAYTGRAVVCLFIAGIFGFSVNAQQMRERFHALDQ